MCRCCLPLELKRNGRLLSVPFIVLQCIFHPQALRTGIVLLVLTNPKLSTCLFQFYSRQSILHFHIQVMMGQHLQNSSEKSGHDWLNLVKKISYQKMKYEIESKPLDM
jgi:hypothetical protein